MPFQQELSNFYQYGAKLSLPEAFHLCTMRLLYRLTRQIALTGFKLKFRLLHNLTPKALKRSVRRGFELLTAMKP